MEQPLVRTKITTGVVAATIMLGAFALYTFWSMLSDQLYPVFFFLLSVPLVSVMIILVTGLYFRNVIGIIANGLGIVIFPLLFLLETQTIIGNQFYPDNQYPLWIGISIWLVFIALFALYTKELVDRLKELKSKSKLAQTQK